MVIFVEDEDGLPEQQRGEGDVPELQTAKLHAALHVHMPAFARNDTISAPCRFFTRSSAKAVTHQLGADVKEALLRIKLLEWNLKKI